MKYYIEEIADCKVVYMRRIGQYGKENYALMSKMKAWADTNGLLSEEAQYLPRGDYNNIRIPRFCLNFIKKVGAIAQ